MSRLPHLFVNAFGSHRGRGGSSWVIGMRLRVSRPHRWSPQRAPIDIRTEPEPKVLPSEGRPTLDLLPDSGSTHQAFVHCPALPPLQTVTKFM